MLLIILKELIIGERVLVALQSLKARLRSFLLRDPIHFYEGFFLINLIRKLRDDLFLVCLETKDRQSEFGLQTIW